MPEPTGVLFYDDDCGLCVRLANLTRRWTGGRIRIAALDSPEADRVLGHLDRGERFSQSWLQLSGRLYGGHEACWHSLYQFPLGWIFRPLRWMPGFQAISRTLYWWVATHRSAGCRVRAERLAHSGDGETGQ